MTHHQSTASPLPEAAEPVAFRSMLGKMRAAVEAMPVRQEALGGQWFAYVKQSDMLDLFDLFNAPIMGAAPSPVAQAPAQAGEVGAFEDWWYGHDGVRQRQVAYLGWPCTKELAESIWNGAREQAASSLPVALQQAREALAYHQAQTRPIDKTVDAIKAIDAALATPPAHPVLAPVVREPLWQPMASAPRDRTLLAKVDGAVRMIRWGKTSHVPLYGFCLADQGPEDFDLCKPDGWMELPAIQATTGEAS